MNPQYVAKNPIKVKRYLNGNSARIIELELFSDWNSIKTPNKNNIVPWAISPNITPNRNGNVIKVKNEGFASWYWGTPYVFVIYCAGILKSFNLK